jgi:hypothetical protein
MVVPVRNHHSTKAYKVIGVKLHTLSISAVDGHEYTVRVFESHVLRRIFGPNREEVTGGYRKLLIEDLHNLYSTKYYDQQIKKDEMGVACSVHGTDEKCIQSLSYEARMEEVTRKTK